MKKPRVVFFGTPELAVPFLKVLASQADIIAVVTRADAEVGRGQELTASPVKREAERLGLTVLQPKKLTDLAFLETLRKLAPDCAVLVAYGRIIPPTLLELPKRGFINVHPSLLPKHRGPSPIVGALLEGDTETGVTVMRLDAEMDHGPIVGQVRQMIDPKDDRTSLEQKLIQAGTRLLTEVLPAYLDGSLTPTAQNHEAASYTKILSRDAGAIDWREPAVVTERKIRAFNPWPGTFTTWNGERLKILSGFGLPESHGQAGQVHEIGGRLCVSTTAGSIVVERLQAAGKKPTDGASFLRGHAGLIGQRLG